MRYALAIEYDGRAFCGFQSQPSALRRAGRAERALSSVAQSGISVVAAGRTDAGVHATSQVVHFDTDAQRPLDRMGARRQHAPARAAAVLWAHAVADDFHARFAASARHYTYLLLARPERPGLNAGRVGWYHRPLDVDAMQHAADRARRRRTISRRSARRSARRRRRSRRLQLARVRAAGDLIRFDFSANAFLHHMIRNIVGALVYVGAGKHDAGMDAALLAARDRARRRRRSRRTGSISPARTTTRASGSRRPRRDVVLAALMRDAHQDLRHHPRRRRARRCARRRRCDRARLLAGHAARRRARAGARDRRRAAAVRDDRRAVRRPDGRRGATPRSTRCRSTSCSSMAASRRTSAAHSAGRTSRRSPSKPTRSIC